MVPCLVLLIRQYCRRFIPPSLYSLLILPIINLDKMSTYLNMAICGAVSVLCRFSGSAILIVVNNAEVEGDSVVR